MAANPPQSFLSRWSRRKLEAREPSVPEAKPVAAATPTAAATTPSTPVAPLAKPELPPVESLSFDSDFTAFLQPDVDPALKREALKKLFSDPRFNVMDGLDVYIDDYTKFEPLAPDVIAKLNQARYLFDPPKTRVNAAGYVEDVPDEPESEAQAEPDAPAASPTPTEAPPRLENVAEEPLPPAPAKVPVRRTDEA